MRLPWQKDIQIEFLCNPQVFASGPAPLPCDDCTIVASGFA